MNKPSIETEISHSHLDFVIRNPDKCSYANIIVTPGRCATIAVDSHRGVQHPGRTLEQPIYVCVNSSVQIAWSRLKHSKETLEISALCNLFMFVSRLTVG